MSLAKDNANRRNAQKSTGPKTEEGKAASRLNALKHGLTSRLIGEEALPNPESEVGNPKSEDPRSEIQNLTSDFARHYDPQGPIEQMLVERIAVLTWRLSRVEMAERKAMNSYPGIEFPLPPAGAMERILKYERTMDRELHRTIDRLETMIARRARNQEDPSQDK